MGLGFGHGSEEGGLEWRRKRRAAGVAAAAMVGESGEAGVGLIARWHRVGRTDGWGIMVSGPER